MTIAAVIFIVVHTFILTYKFKIANYIMARPTKLTPESHKRIIQAIRLGATYELAAGYGGVAYNTFNEWMKRGKANNSGKFREFHDDIKRAEAEGATGWLAKIEAAANDGNWQAAAWKLERRYPREYGKQVIEHSGDGTIAIVNVDMERI